jgi:Protein of unknown function (DUF3631)
LPGERVQHLSPLDSNEWAALRSQQLRWAIDHEKQLRAAPRVDIHALHDRENDNWHALLQSKYGTEAPLYSKLCEDPLAFGSRTSSRLSIDGQLPTGPLANFSAVNLIGQPPHGGVMVVRQCDPPIQAAS